MSPTSLLHTNPHTNRVSQAIVGSDDGILGTIRPVRYRYVMADIRTGKVIANLPMTGVTYGIGIYVGTEMAGTVYLPDMLLDEMPHTPLNVFERWEHPDRGLPLGSMFEVGNRALYVMRNEEVVWGGILWSRSYSSGDKTMSITGLSWEGYAYYRAFRKSIVFPNTTSKYTIWRAVLKAILAYDPETSDFSWGGDDGNGLNAGNVADIGVVPWTGKTRTVGGVATSNAELTIYSEFWPHNSPPIELPSAGMEFVDPDTQASPAFTTTSDRWRGYEMGMVGDQLQTWADANNLVSSGGFEYRVLCWWDEEQERFRQRYTFGEMEYDANGEPVAIINPLLGRPYEQAMDTIFDFPGHISEWSLSDSMEDVCTRVIVTGDTGDEAYAKIAEYRSHIDLLRPGFVGNGSDGWLLYDKVVTYESSSPSEIGDRADLMLQKMRPSIAASVNDIANVNSTTQRTSNRATDLSITLYQDPTTVFPDWNIGDWVTFAIEDPLYGGRMYLQRRIVGYQVTVVPDHESEYSHEQITLELTDQTKIAESA